MRREQSTPRGRNSLCRDPKTEKDMMAQRTAGCAGGRDRWRGWVAPEVWGKECRFYGKCKQGGGMTW